MPAVVIAEPSPDWPVEFARTARELGGALAGAAVSIEHIGSTSVPGLCAKPVVDLLMGCPSLAMAEAAIAPLATLGFRYVPEHEDVLPDRRYFVRAAGARLRANLHAVVEGGDFWVRHLAFRDALRADAALRAAYGDLKRTLAVRFADDRPAYTDAKGPFIAAVLARRASAG